MRCGVLSRNYTTMTRLPDPNLLRIFSMQDLHRVQLKVAVNRGDCKQSATKEKLPVAVLASVAADKILIVRHLLLEKLCRLSFDRRSVH